MSPPCKLLEINLISAQDLPPLAKVLRTFALAYITPDNKLTTKIDHHGHTNPKWNHKMQFTVDGDFLEQELPTVTIEIFNLAWLRDLPIGTAKLNLNTLSPSLSEKRNYRRVTLQVCRPTGHLKGKVNLGIKLVDCDGGDVKLRDLGLILGESIKVDDFGGPEKTPSPKIEIICSIPEKNQGSEIVSKDESDCSISEKNQGLEIISKDEKECSTPDFNLNTEITSKDESVCSGSEKDPSPKIASKDESVCSTANFNLNTEVTSKDESVCSGSDFNLNTEIASKAESVCSGSEAASKSESVCSANTLRPELEPQTRTVTSSGSEYSAIPPPWLGADDVKTETRTTITSSGSEYSAIQPPPWLGADDIKTETTRTVTSADSEYSAIPPPPWLGADDIKTKTWLGADDVKRDTRTTITSSGSEYSAIPPPPWLGADDIKTETTRTVTSADSEYSAVPPPWLGADDTKTETTRTVTSADSEYSAVPPPPVWSAPDDLKTASEAYKAEYGSEIFKNWTEAGDSSIAASPQQDDLKKEIYAAEYGDNWTESGDSISSINDSRCLPSEDPKKEEIYTAEHGGAILDSWTEVGDRSSNGTEQKPEQVEWTELGQSTNSTEKTPESVEWTEAGESSNATEKTPENVEWAAKNMNNNVKPAMGELTLDCRRKRPEPVKKNKLFKIFGNAYGFQFSLICGSNLKKMRNKRNLKKGPSRMKA